MAGLTDTGFTRATQDEIAAEIAADERGTISAQLDVSESSAIGNLNNIFADQMAQAWEVLEEVVNAFDPDNATDSRMVSLALLTGVTRRGAQKGLVTATVNLTASQSYEPGDLVAHVLNEPTNRWVNRDTVSSGSSGNYPAVFEAETAGSAASAASGTLTVIASPIAGWNSITNADDATPGTDGESIEELRARREASLAKAGSGTVDAIRADVLEVEGVIEALVEENTSDSLVGTLPPHSFRVVVWDGATPAADDDEIAQAIQDTRPAGIYAAGDESGTARKSDGATVTVYFARADVLDIYVSANISSADGVAIDDVKAAISAAMPSLVGGDVIYKKLLGAGFIDGVDDIPTFTIGTTASPVGTSNISVSATQMTRLQLSNIVLTGDVS